MAEAIVPSLIKLIPDVLKLLQEEWKLGSDAKTELEYLEDLIGAIGRFLKKATLKEVIDEDLKASMKRARKFIYDSQDALDDFIQRGNWKWEGLGLYIYDQYNRRTFSSEAKRIRQMVENYKTTLETSNALSADHAKSSWACHRSLSIAFSSEKDNELVGIKKAREQLVGWLTADSLTRKVIFVHGAQGVGKTSLVGSVLRHETVRSHFSSYVWINLRSYELVNDKAAALMKANAEIWDATEKDNLGSQLELEEVFQRFWKENNRWVLVLDDVGSTHVFESLRSLLAQTHPSVLVTTRDSSLESNSRIFLDSQMALSDGAPLEPSYDIRHFKHLSLSFKDSSTLLCGKTLQKDCYQDGLKDAFVSIVKQCQGLPLAILGASNLLRDIQGGVNGTPQGVKWKKLSGRLGEALLFKGDKSDLIRRMITLRMDHLRDVYACLFYLSIFPLNRPINCSTLMRLWMAERLIEQKGTNPVQTIAEETLKKLVDHNIFQKVEKTSYERAKTCRIYNILHQIIISKSKDDEFAMIVADLEEGWPETVWRLSFHSKMDHLKDGNRVKRLRSLLVFGKVDQDSLEELLGQVSRLNVLNIQHSSLKSFPKEICCSTYLRYLSLRGTKINKIHDDIGGLIHLETLDLKGTRVTELPKSILKLKALRHLLISRTGPSPAPSEDPKCGVKAPSRLGKLTSLQKLWLIDVNQGKRSIKQKIKLSIKQSIGSNITHEEELLGELGELKNLRRLGISNLEYDHMRHLRSSIEKLKKLESLHLIAADQGMLDLLRVDKRQSSPFLERVHLTGYMGTLPQWILSPSLAKLVLKESQINESNPLQHFKDLPCLKHLDLQQAFKKVKVMNFERGGFQQLRFLGLGSFPILVSINIEEKALPALERLFLGQCEKLTTVPQGIAHPKQFKCLEFYEMPQAFETAVKRDRAIHAHKKLRIGGAVVEGYPRGPITERPESSRPGVASRYSSLQGSSMQWHQQRQH